MIKSNFLKTKLAKQKTTIGTWSVIPSPIVADVIASCGIDFIIIDMEHGPASFETAQSMIMACESRNVSPVIRVTGVNESEILKALDIGAHCIQIPNVSSLESLKEIVRYAKFPPLGNRGFSPFTRACNYSHLESQNYTEKSNENSMIAVHIEGAKAVENIDELLTVPEINIFFIGLYDISKSLGIPGQVDDERVLQLLKKAVKKINAAGKYSGTIATNKDQLKQFIDMGISYITYSVDCEMLSRSYQELNHLLKK